MLVVIAALLALANARLGSAQGSVTATLEVRNLEGGGSGEFTVQVHPEWAPLGASRFRDLSQANFYSEARFFRVVDGFLAQFGVNGDPAVGQPWQHSKLKDEAVATSNLRGRLAFASAGPNTRTTQVFVNLKDNTFLDRQGFAPFAEVIEGMDVVDRLFKAYGDNYPNGDGPDLARIQQEGNNYLNKKFPKLSCITAAWMRNNRTSGPEVRSLIT